MKRKASSLESDCSSYPCYPSSPPSMTFSSTTSSPDSMNTEPFHSSLATFNYHLLPATNAPWLHSRTRKRVRDNRPDETQIHADTVRRLFDAQRPQPQSEDAMMMDGIDYNSSHSPNMELFYTEDQESGDMNELSTPDEVHNITTATNSIEANQRSLHDFFRRATQTTQHSVPPPSLTLHSRTPSATSLAHAAIRPPTPQEISAGVPAPVVLTGPVLRERPSMGFLGGINASSSPERELEDMSVVLGGAIAAGGGGYLPCDFRAKVEAEAAMALQLQGRGDAMVMG